MTKDYSSEEIDKCIEMLENMASQSELVAQISEKQRVALLSAAGRVSRPDRKYLKQRRKELNRIERQPAIAKDRAARASTGIRSARETDLFEAPDRITVIPSTDKGQRGEQLNSPRNCYVCKAKYTTLHHFYDAMCPECAEFNYQKRFQSASLEGQVALITGARLKIGYQATLMMLRAGARVIATTRFPVDAAIRYSREKDFHQWRDRLNIYGLDLRHIPSVEIFAGYIENNYHRLDILINNAAQTVRRPPGFYAHLMENENLTTDALQQLNGGDAAGLLEEHRICKEKLNIIYLQQQHRSKKIDLNRSQKADHTTLSGHEIPAISNMVVEAPLLSMTWHSRDDAPGIGLLASAQLSQIPYSFDDSAGTEEIFPRGALDMDLQQVDLRTTNSWRLKLGQIHTSEMVEVQLVNAVAPFVLCNRLIDLMKKSYTGEKHIVNVTAMEGKFHRFKQASRHPHTNMAKAALNMMTHTAAADLAKHGIYINAVDTGWVTDEDPVALAKRKEEIHDFQPPLDIVDGAARICDPFFNGILTGKHWCGKFLKDYKPIDW